jgi:hypothetical protein
MKLWLLALSFALALAPSPSQARGGGGGGGGKAAPAQKPAEADAAPGSGVAAPTAVRTKNRQAIGFGAPIQFHNISIIPVTTRVTGDVQRYTLLEQGLKAKTLKVRELNGNDGEAQVSAVEIRNTGNDPVYLLGGEMILGGKQDRIIAQDTVVVPAGSWVKVGVFCVEQGRWRGQNMAFSSGKAMADVSIRRAAMKGSQSEVWSEVEKKNVLHGTTSATQTYRRTIQNAAVRKKIKPYIKQLRARLPRDEKLAGLVFGVNGKIHVADIFGNPVLFRDLEEKLLSAYVLEALGHQVDRDAKPVSAGGARNFIGKVRRAKVKGTKASGDAENIAKEEDDFIGNETVDSRSKKTVRESYLAK